MAELAVQTRGEEHPVSPQTGPACTDARPSDNQEADTTRHGAGAHPWGGRGRGCACGCIRVPASPGTAVMSAIAHMQAVLSVPIPLLTPANTCAPEVAYFQSHWISRVMGNVQVRAPGRLSALQTLPPIAHHRGAACLRRIQRLVFTTSLDHITELYKCTSTQIR